MVLARSELIRKWIGAVAPGLLVVRFAATGVFNTAVYAVVFAGLKEFAGVAPGWASAIGYVASLATGFFSHRRFSFLLRARPRTAEIARYVAAQATVLGLSSAAAALTSGTLGWPTWGVIASGVAVVPLLNFILLRYWVFRPV